MYESSDAEEIIEEMNHNVVIVVMPDGEYGGASAAGVARDTLRSFLNVGLGFIVGIGGGAPNTEQDLRLVDIVANVPQSEHCGVFQ